MVFNGPLHPERETMFFSQKSIEERAGGFKTMDERSDALVIACASFGSGTTELASSRRTASRAA